MYYPYCSNKNQKYPDASVRLVDKSPNPEFGISLQNCTTICYIDPQCNFWTYVEQNSTCYYINDVGSASLVDVNDNGTTYYSADWKCVTPIVAPALAEDAEELSYIQICSGDEYEEVKETIDTWNITTCPSEFSFDEDLSKLYQEFLALEPN